MNLIMVKKLLLSISLGIVVTSTAALTMAFVIPPAWFGV
jgi:hypothetical protein